EKILVEEDDDAEVGADLVLIGDGSGSASSEAGESGGEAAAGGAAEEAPAAEPAAAAEEPEPAREEPAREEPAEAPSASGSAASGEDVTMPALGESVTEGTVTRWLKAVGETVEVDEPLLEVS